ncbi:MAG: hypothetical protein HYU51_06665 [Candidatus Rokubacteria bacterium]|nr:hypothetical protein [Candidatus Rokubacteria bacterium]
MHQFLIVPLVVLVLAACATGRPTSQRSEFEDIPVPKGLTLEPGKSTIIESPSVKAARLVYRGRIEPGSLAVAMRTTLEANGWRNVSSTTTGQHGAMQVYEKGGNSLQVQVWEGLWYTYVELTASRATQPARQ